MIDKKEFEKLQRDNDKMKKENQLLNAQLEELQFEFEAVIQENERSKLDKIVVDKMFAIRGDRIERELWNIARENRELKKEVNILQLDRNQILNDLSYELKEEKKLSAEYQKGLTEIKLEFDEISAENQQMKKAAPKLTRIARKNRDYLEEIKVLKTTIKWLQRKRRIDKNRINDLIEKKKSVRNRRLEDARKALQDKLRDLASLPYSLEDLNLPRF